MAHAARAALRLDLVLLVPAGDSWRKHDRSVTAARHRLAMVRAAVVGQDGLDVLDMEVRRSGPTYTSETLVALRAEGHEQIWFILGSDALLDLPHWYEPQRILALSRLALVARPGHSLPAAELDALLPGLSAVTDVVPLPPEDRSATAIRARFVAGTTPAREIPPETLAYIRRHELYAGSPSIYSGAEGDTTNTHMSNNPSSDAPR